MSKKVVITGTSRGIGLELVKLFSKAGHHILALSRNLTVLQQLELPNVVAIPFDLTDESNFETVKTFVSQIWGEVDIVVHNAGLLVNKPFESTTREDFEKVYAANVFGLASLTRTLLPYFCKGSHVVSISSMGGVQGSVKFAGLSAYTSSKGAVITLTELLAEEYKDSGISFNVLALGAVQTEMLAEAFPGYRATTSAEQMAAYIYDFALNGNAYYNGKLLQVSNSTP
ncbi:MAG TPA: SDR family oxidoreductase [Aquaticitalea sp.]|nr:SDR family oxidoreductase [Aquaticitalea sp.]HNU59835.1 SDR family oxidoreductase [Aquaticitalea sp.]